MAWRLKLSSTFVYGASSTCVHATAKMRTSSTKDIGGVDHFGVPPEMERAGPTGPEPFLVIDGDDVHTATTPARLPHLNMFLKPWATPLALWLILTADAKARSSNTSHYDASSYQLSARLSVHS